MAESDDKTEKPTAKRRRDERKKGNVLMSKDVVTVASMLTTSCTLWFNGGNMVAQLEEILLFSTDLIATGGADLVVTNAEVIMAVTVSSFLIVAGPLMVVASLTAVIATLYQTKGLFSFEKIKPDFKKLDPIKGFKNLFSLKSVVDAVKNSLKIIVLLYIVYKFVSGKVLGYIRFFGMSPMASGTELMSDIFTMVLQIFLAFVALAGFDFGYQWWEYEKNLRMSKQDIKDEYKQTEGDPKVKGKIKQKQMMMAQQRMMQQVPAADVIVRNPTHFAVAMRYQEGDFAPFVLAKGQDNLAFQIIKIGEEHGVPIIEDVPVARALYATAEVGEFIPPDMYGPMVKIIQMVRKIDENNRGI